MAKFPPPVKLAKEPHLRFPFPSDFRDCADRTDFRISTASVSRRSRRFSQKFMQLFPGKSICFFFGTPCAAFAKASTDHGRIGAGEKVLNILRKSARSAGTKELNPRNHLNPWSIFVSLPIGPPKFPKKSAFALC